MNEQNLPEAPEAKKFSSSDFTNNLADEDGHFLTAVAEQKQKQKIRLLVILSAICVLLGIGFLGSRFLNYYDRTLRNVLFDYREGESVISSDISDGGEKALAISDSIGGSIHIDAVEMWFSISNRTIEDSISGMIYEYSGVGESLSIRTGVRNALLTKKSSLRRRSGVCEEEQKGEWTTVSDAQLPCLLDFCFSATDHGNSLLHFDSSYSTRVNGTAYNCEVWLLETKLNGITSYFTLYRYYGSDNRLSAVRVLPGSSNLMAVYEIKNYTFL